MFIPIGDNIERRTFPLVTVVLILANALVFVLCSEVGGTHPVLVEAMAAGNCVIVNNTPTNLEVVGDAGLKYEGAGGADSLREVLQHTLGDDMRLDELRQRVP